ncbi:hypothetical protein D3C86_895070 [compost metagenome]
MSPAIPMKKTGMAAMSNLRMVGALASSGNRLRMRSRRARTSSMASCRLVPQRKLRRTWLWPSAEVEVTSSRPWTPETASSMGRVSRVSISSGPTPE